MLTRTFKAMNTRFHIWLDAQTPEARDALDAAEAFVHEVEATLSRFRADSALSRVNRQPGQWHVIPQVMADVVGEALLWAQRTQGLFDPTVLPSMHAIGYTHSFERIQRDGARPPVCHGSSSSGVGRWGEVRLEGDRLYLPPGTGLDLGGIAKEWTADRVAVDLSEWGACLVDAGGDIRAVGAPALWGTWPVAVAHPLHPEDDVISLGLTSGALATSSRVRRRWRTPSREVHHIIDPRTGDPASTPVLSASVIAPTTVMAGVLSKVALLLGEEGLAYVEKFPHAHGILIMDDGRILMSPALEVIHHG